MIAWIKSWFGPKTVASITAEFDKVVDDLKAAEDYALKKWNFHQDMVTLHAKEQQAAAKIGAQIKALVS